MRLRELKEKDVLGMYLWMHYEETRDIFEKDFSKYTKEDILNFIRNQGTNDINYACVDSDDSYLGTISLKNIDKKNLNAELAISFIKEAQGTGVTGFAMNEILKFAFTKLKLKKIYLNVLATNKRAIQFYKKNGFIQEGCFKKHIKKEKKYIDLLWYAISDDQFKK